MKITRVEHVIDPRGTRPTIVKTLKMLENKKEDPPGRNTATLPFRTNAECDPARSLKRVINRS